MLSKISFSMILSTVLVSALMEAPAKESTVTVFREAAGLGHICGLSIDDNGRVIAAMVNLGDQNSRIVSLGKVPSTSGESTSPRDLTEPIPLLSGESAALLGMQGGHIWLAATPTLWRLEDDNDDLRIDRRLSWIEHVGRDLPAERHGLRALASGPDGLVYFTVGDCGVKVSTENGVTHVLTNEGGLFSCTAEGSRLQLIARGLRDPAALVVTVSGRILVADIAPIPNKSRLLEIMRGADYGWRANMPPETDLWTKEVIPSLVPPLPALAIVDARITTLTSCPAAEGERVMVTEETDAGKGSLLNLALAISKNGTTATFSGPIWEGNRITAAAVAPDGSILFAESTAEDQSPAACIIRRLADDSYQLLAADEANFAEMVPDSLVSLLAHPVPRIQQSTRRALAARPYRTTVELLQKAALPPALLRTRLQALRTLGEMCQRHPFLLHEVALHTVASEPEIRVLVLRILAEGRYANAAEWAVPSLHDPIPDVRVAAAAALAAIGSPSLADALINEQAHGIERSGQKSCNPLALLH